MVDPGVVLDGIEYWVTGDSLGKESTFLCSIAAPQSGKHGVHLSITISGEIRNLWFPFAEASAMTASLGRQVDDLKRQLEAKRDAK